MLPSVLLRLQAMLRTPGRDTLPPAEPQSLVNKDVLTVALEEYKNLMAEKISHMGRTGPISVYGSLVVGALVPAVGSLLAGHEEVLAAAFFSLSAAFLALSLLVLGYLFQIISIADQPSKARVL